MRRLALLYFLCQAGPLLAESAGTASADFLKFGVGARYLAMGGAAVGTADDATAVYWNPANLALLKTGNVIMMRGDTLDTGRYDYAGFARPTPWGGMGASIQTAAPGPINFTDETGFSNGELRPQDTAFSLGWGIPIGHRWAVGATGDFVHSKIIHTANAFSLGLGGAYQWKTLRFGLGMRHLVGSQLKYDQEKSPLPRTLQTGVSYHPKENWIFALDANDTRGSPTVVSIGAEYGHPLFISQKIFLRTGYSTRPSDLPGLQGFSFGFGWRWQLMDVDYAFVPMGHFDGSQTHRFSVGVRFGSANVYPRAAPRIRDEDKDGVPDHRDDCPGTPPQRKVNPRGCPETIKTSENSEIEIAPSPLPVAVDADNDGIPDDKDICPDTPVSTVVNLSGCTISIPFVILFKTGSAAVLIDYEDSVRRIAEFVAKYPDYAVLVEGHSDSKGPEEYNMALSWARARVVRELLVKFADLEHERITLHGDGVLRPISSNVTPTGRRQNRRVVIRLLLSTRGATTSPAGTAPTNPDK